MGPAMFGQSESITVVELDGLFGAPKTPLPVAANDCGVDAFIDWPTISAYFSDGSFVGYGTGSLLGGPGHRSIPVAATSQGLRVGDTLSEGQSLYGRLFSTSYAQGGSWLLNTPNGDLYGLLLSPTGDMGRLHADDLVVDIAAGLVGCPAATP
ncbi:MAG: hypothetical protein ACRDYB_05725 [Acidimicrobiales bacterium]